MPTVTLSSLLERAVRFLQGRGVGSARAEAEHLLAHIRGCRRYELPLRREERVERVWLAEFLPLLRRRGRREPLAYVLGKADFHELSLRCDRRALIPRPETEELVEGLLGRWEKNPPDRVLDLGTGSGAIGLALARAFPKSRVTAVDLDPDALDLARENAKRNRVDNVRFVRSDWFEKVRGRFDLIVANPPYLTAEELESAEPEVRDYEPRRALGAAEEGRAELFRILRSAGDFMSPPAWLVMEMGIAHGEVLRQEAENLGFTDVRIRRDLSGRPRFFLASRGLLKL
ncbi:MAG: peptide chain release factor N(5)-glutamine methyltransferase [Puniceicoccales bacterium]|jgi:release factor glutamine methyltransferase|nr:peptide chain release factor N(5)-glutamine methyltransferase [Puniceicoccales bacterium]